MKRNIIQRYEKTSKPRVAKQVKIIKPVKQTNEAVTFKVPPWIEAHTSSQVVGLDSSVFCYTWLMIMCSTNYTCIVVYKTETQILHEVS